MGIRKKKINSHAWECRSLVGALDTKITLQIWMGLSCSSCMHKLIENDLFKEDW